MYIFFNFFLFANRFCPYVFKGKYIFSICIFSNESGQPFEDPGQCTDYRIAVTFYLLRCDVSYEIKNDINNNYINTNLFVEAYIACNKNIRTKMKFYKSMAAPCSSVVEQSKLNSSACPNNCYEAFKTNEVVFPLQSDYE